MATQRSHYEVLGVGSDADSADVKRAFTARVKALHPDLHHSLEKEAHDQLTGEMQLVTEAWRVLRDPDARRDYDTTLAWEIGGTAGSSENGRRSGAAPGVVANGAGSTSTAGRRIEWRNLWRRGRRDSGSGAGAEASGGQRQEPAVAAQQMSPEASPPTEAVIERPAGNGVVTQDESMAPAPELDLGTRRRADRSPADIEPDAAGGDAEPEAPEAGRAPAQPERNGGVVPVEGRADPDSSAPTDGEPESDVSRPNEVVMDEPDAVEPDADEARADEPGSRETPVATARLARAAVYAQTADATAHGPAGGRAKPPIDQVAPMPGNGSSPGSTPRRGSQPAANAADGATSNGNGASSPEDIAKITIGSPHHPAIPGRSGVPPRRDERDGREPGERRVGADTRAAPTAVLDEDEAKPWIRIVLPFLDG